MIDFSVPLAGLQQAEARLERTAQRLARASSPEDTVDLSAEMVALIEARLLAQANLNVLRTQAEIAKELL